jgi:hypothetical protein
MLLPQPWIASQPFEASKNDPKTVAGRGVAIMVSSISHFIAYPNVFIHLRPLTA